METKAKIKAGTILMALFIIVFSGFNLYFYYNQDGSSYSSMSGLFIKDIPSNVNISLIVFIGQWVVLLLVVFLAYMKFLKHKQEEEHRMVGIQIPQTLSLSETHIDTFYKVLQSKKILGTNMVAKLFHITNEQAIEWAKILEDAELVTIEYPAFSDPQVKLKQDPIEEEKEKKEKMKEDKNKPLEKNTKQEEKDNNKNIK